MHSKIIVNAPTTVFFLQSLMTYHFSCTDCGTNIGVMRRLPSARRVSICFSIALTGVTLLGITGGSVDNGTELISMSPPSVAVWLFTLLFFMLLLFTIIDSDAGLLSSFNSSEYSGTMPLSLSESFKLRSIAVPYSR